MSSLEPMLLNIGYYFDIYFDIPIVFIRGAWLAITNECLYQFLKTVSDIYNLGWDFFN